jgi:hypothetical protein
MKTRLIFPSLIALALVACKTTTTVNQPEGEKATVPESIDNSMPTNAQESLAARANDRWKLIIAGEFAKAYEYLSPGYRETRPKAEYVDTLRNRPIRWTKSEINDQACSETDVCTVKVLIEYEFEMPTTGVGKVTQFGVIEEKWLRLDGVWYFLPTSSSNS